MTTGVASLLLAALIAASLHGGSGFHIAKRSVVDRASATECKPFVNARTRRRLDDDDEREGESPGIHLIDRRKLLRSSPFLIGALSSRVVRASDEEAPPAVSQAKLASLLKQVPTFAIVDTRGVPFFVVGEDAKLTSYFFTSYEEARRILDVAIKSSDKAIAATKKEIKAKRGAVTKEDEEEIGTNPWRKARITTVPLDLAVTLSSKGKLAGAYFRLAPNESDIVDALETDKTDDLPEGRVPLFYIEEMKINEGNEMISPLYFQKKQCLKEWRKQSKSSPEVKVTELSATLGEMLSGTDTELQTLRFIPIEGSKSRSQQILKKESEPFRLGERIVVL